jgi:hypothetical protein
VFSVTFNRWEPYACLCAPVTHENNELGCNFLWRLIISASLYFYLKPFLFMLAIIEMTKLFKLGVTSVKCNTVEVCSSINYAQKCFSKLCRYKYIVPTNFTMVGRDSSVGIACWTVQGLNPSGGKIFCTCPDQPWNPPSLLYNGYRVFPVV